LKTFLVILLAYILGSIPFGYLIVRVQSGADIREVGSGGTGATNVSRRAGKGAGLLTLLLDAAKGALAVFLARLWLSPDGSLTWPVGLAALAVIVGHVFPVWLGFRGGKGVATGAGVLLMLVPFAVLIAGILFLAVVLLTRYVSLASILAAAAVPIFVWLQLQFYQPRADGETLVTITVGAALLIIFAHRSNIERLTKGTESRFR
jgi:acyl phosphate:glycerol-3-phosphate acyltransferase